MKGEKRLSLAEVQKLLALAGVVVDAEKVNESLGKVLAERTTADEKIDKAAITAQFITRCNALRAERGTQALADNRNAAIQAALANDAAIIVADAKTQEDVRAEMNLIGAGWLVGYGSFVPEYGRGLKGTACILSEIGAEFKERAPIVHVAGFKRAVGFVPSEELVTIPAHEFLDEAIKDAYIASGQLPLSQAQIGIAVKTWVHDKNGNARLHFKFAGQGQESWSYLVMPVYSDNSPVDAVADKPVEQTAPTAKKTKGKKGNQPSAMIA